MNQEDVKELQQLANLCAIRIHCPICGALREEIDPAVGWCRQGRVWRLLVYNGICPECDANFEVRLVREELPEDSFT